MLREMEAGIKAVRCDLGGEKIEFPVKLKAHDSDLRRSNVPKVCRSS